MLSREDIIKHMGDIVAEYDADPNKYAYALGQFLGLYDAIKLGNLIPSRSSAVKGICDEILAAEDLSATIDGINAEPDVPEGVCHKCGWGMIVRGQDGYECPNCHGYTE